MSPPPKFPPLTTATRQGTAKPTAAPKNGCHPMPACENVSLKTTKSTAKTARTLSGIIIYVKSLTDTIINREIKAHERISSRDHPTSRKAAVNREAVTSSTNVYKRERRAPQKRHLPFNNRKERTGMRSRAASRSPQSGQWEGGRTIDSRFGTRSPTTL